MKRLLTMEEVEDESMCPPLLSKVDQATASPNCPRCDSSNTKFCYHNNYSLTQPRYFCKGCRRYWTEGGRVGGHRASHRKPQHFRSEKTQILIDRVSELKNIGYHGMDGTELGEAKEIWSGNPRLPKDAEIRAVVRHFRPMLRSFTNDEDGVQPTTLSDDDDGVLPTTLSDDDDGVQPSTLSDRRFRNYCLTLLSKLVGDTIRGSAVSVLEHGGITDIEDGLRYFVRGPNVCQHLRGEASSSRTTDTAGTLMGDGRRHDQDPRMKEFRNYAYWITSLSITILVGLLSANKRQPDLLFRSCSSLASGASICGIAMLMLVLIRPSSQSALTCLKTMQYLTIGLLFVAAVLVFTLL